MYIDKGKRKGGEMNVSYLQHCEKGGLQTLEEHFRGRGGKEKEGSLRPFSLAKERKEGGGGGTPKSLFSQGT